jgi:hypothetical protein
MKSRSAQSVLTFFLVCLVMLVAACSETTKKAPELPDLVFQVHFPFINDSEVFSIENTLPYGDTPKEDELNILENKRLFSVPSGLLLALDTDQSTKNTESSIETFSHTALPEFIAYAKPQTLHIFDLNTRHDHEVYSFASDEFFEPAENDVNSKSVSRYICDLQKVITWDEESRLSRKVLFKDEMAVYVKTSTQEDCSEAAEGFEYWQINIEASSNEEDDYNIRRKVLKEHSHQHRHFHDHSNENDPLFAEHDHIHVLEPGERDEDGLPFEPNDHKHKHTHSHDFVYGPEHAHDELTQEEIDAVHNDPKNHEIKFETHPKLVGKRTTITSIDEALMYSGTPVINTVTRNFGYLGLNSKTDSLNFYSVDLETLNKTLLWTQSDIKLADLINSPVNLTHWEALVPAYNRAVNFTSVKNGIVIYTTNNVFNFTLDSLFDDDASELRAQALTTPLFSSNVADSPINLRSHYNQVQNRLVITENNQVWLIDFNEELPSPTLIKTFNEPNLHTIRAQAMGNSVMVSKTFAEDSVFSTSISTVNENGLETNTLVTKTQDEIHVSPQQDQSLLTIINNDDGAYTARYLLNNFGSPLPVLLETLWVSNAFDYRNNVETRIIAQLSSDNLPIIPGTVEQPVIYLLDEEDSSGRGESFGTVQNAVKSASNFVIFNEFYSILLYRNSENESFYYWNIIQY